MSDIENDWESDHEVSKEHSKLLDSVSKLDKGQRVKIPERSEPSIQVSEFHLVKSGITDKDAVHINDLLRTLHTNPSHRPITQKLKALNNNSKVLAKPLEKPQADKLKREVGFENAKQEIQKWDAIITRNRTAPKLTFPLTQGQVSFKGTTTDEFVKRFRVQSDLEKELAALEPPKPEEDDNKDEFPLTLGEILERRREAAKFRAQQSYKEAKAHRQNKIKSKKFHKIARKAKIKQQIKDFEQLQKTDPEAALEKLEQLDKTRAEERMSLRHKSTGQWAKNKQVRAKYDTESRKVLAQQLSISRELTQKIKKSEDSDDDDDDDDDVGVVNGGDNPWTNPGKSSSEIDEFVTGYRKYWDEKNKIAEMKKNEENGDRKSGVNEENHENGVEIVACHVPDALNPVEDVVEEYESIPDEEIQNKKNSKKSKNNESKCKIEKVKFNGKIIKVKMSQAKFTSEWAVETFPAVKSRKSSKTGESPVDIDELFDKMEDKLKVKVSKKGRRVKQKIRKLDKYEELEDNDDERNSDDQLPDLSFKNRKVRPELGNEALDETHKDGVEVKITRNSTIITKKIADNGGVKGLKRKAEIDPTKFISVKPKHLKTQLPDDVMGAEEAMDDSEGDEAQHNMISEAFADDDVVDEFRKEKEDEIKKSQPEDLDLRLPGWGSWGGKNINQNLRKKRRFIMKFPKEVARKDENKGDVIIVEDANTQIKRHLVAELPYPFTSVADYEASIRAPIGRDFVTENAHKRLTDPTVETKMGTIIEPMDEDVLLNKKNKIGGLLPDKENNKNQLGKGKINQTNHNNNNKKKFKKTGIKQKKN